MKKIISMLCAGALVIALAGCNGEAAPPSTTAAKTDAVVTQTTGTEESTESLTDAPTETLETEEPEVTGIAFDPVELDLDRSQVTLNGFTIDGDKVILHWDFTNTGTDNEKPIAYVRVKVFQDGVELDSAILFTENAGNGIKDVQPEGTISLDTGFKMTSKNPITIEISSTTNLNAADFSQEYPVS